MLLYNPSARMELVLSDFVVKFRVFSPKSGQRMTDIDSHGARWSALPFGFHVLVLAACVCVCGGG